jgi:hypothetical protein
MRRAAVLAVLCAACGESNGVADAGLRDAGACAPRTSSLEERPLDPAAVCTTTSAYLVTTWQRGCGYVQQVVHGDVGDAWVSVWDEASGKLVYSSFNGALSAGCAAPSAAGTFPSCDTWATAC